MRKTILYILLLGIFAFGVWFFLFKDQDLFGVNEAGFKVTNTDAIAKIFLAKQDGDSVSIQLTDSGWVVNNKYPVRERMIGTLLSTLKEQEAAYPVPENAHNNIVKALAGIAIKVELYNKQDDKIKTFYVGGQAHDKAGTYMLMEGAKKPYVVQLPVFQGYLTPRYSTSLADWRDRNVFDVSSKELQEFTITYTQEELNNFTLKRQEDGSFNVITHPALMEGKKLNEKRTNSFAGFLTNINCEGYLNGVHKLDSIIANADKYCEIDVKGNDGTDKHLDIYWMFANKRSRNTEHPRSEVPNEYDGDRLYAVFNNGTDTAIIQRLTFAKLFRKGYEFYQQDEE